MKLFKSSENDIQRAILDYLTVSGVYVWRQNTGAFAGEHKGKKWFVRFGAPGMSDILGILPPEGRLLAIEVKRPGERPTQKQAAFIEQINSLGGVAFWVDSLDAVVDWYQQYKRRAG